MFWNYQTSFPLFVFNLKKKIFNFKVHSLKSIDLGLDLLNKKFVKINKQSKMIFQTKKFTQKMYCYCSVRFSSLIIP